MIIKNLTNNNVLSLEAWLADTFFTRARGLLGVPSFKDGQCLIITHCNSIHMFFMKFAIDAVFLDRNSHVVGLVRHIKPNQLSPIFWKADKVLELPTGTIERTKTSLGDQMQIVS